MKVILRILLFSSLIFVIVYLNNNNLLRIPDFRNPYLFGFSLLLVIFGFVIDVKAWQIIARTSIPELDYKQAYISTGKYIFTKYIPGKLWVIMGKAAYLKQRFNRPILDLSSFSVYYQLIAIITGTLTGSYVLFFIDTTLALIIYFLIFILIIIAFFFYETILQICSGLLTRIFKRLVEIPSVPFIVTFKLGIFSLFNWIVWAVAFLIFLISVNTFNADVQFAAGLLFPISSIIGILFLIAPGGIGIREGFLALGLAAMGFSAKDAASVAILSRLWFLIGETLFFLTAGIINIVQSKRIESV